MGNETIDFSHLNLLRTTSDKKTVLHLFTQTFNNRLGGANAHLTKEWLELFDAGEEDIEMLFNSILSVIRYCLYESLSSTETIAEIFPEDFHPQLGNLISKIIVAKHDEWRSQSLGALVPKLVNFDWRLDLKSASNQLSRMSVPTVLINMEVQQRIKKVTIEPEVEKIQFEMSKESLDTMLEGLRKIKDQLGQI